MGGGDDGGMFTIFQGKAPFDRTDRTFSRETDRFVAELETKKIITFLGFT